MTSEQLIEGKELQELITVTENALTELKKIVPQRRPSQKIHDDKIFNLTICEHKDGSGIRAILARYSGNEALLQVIIKELERQLNDFKSQFETL